MWFKFLWVLVLAGGFILLIYLISGFIWVKNKM